MSADFPPDLEAELLDDFFAECDELLGQMRAELAAIEPALDQAAPHSAALERLFRSVHSFKGNSAIVGLRTAERLAHATEDFLRALSRGSLRLDAAGFELLARATQRLEQIVGAHRLHQPLPAIDDLMAPLSPFDTTAAAADSPAAVAPLPPSLHDEAGAQMEAAAARGLVPWLCTFAPTAELDRRGINIGAVRARLGAIGEIVRATPQVGVGGAITFAFEMALREIPTDLAEWENDGCKLRPLETAAPAATSSAPGASDAGLFVAPAHIVRVDLGRLDELMRITGEMVVQRSRLEERIHRNHGNGDNRSELQEVNLALGRSLRELRGAITRVRLVSVAEIFSRMPYVVRDLAQETGKKVRLQLEGHQTEVDKYLVERLKEPLLHLVRNALSHGIETPAERRAAGKPEEATLLLSATTAGETAVMRIRDDGHGIDAAAVMARAAASGLDVPETADSATLLDLLCTPGFSTRESADRASGRGVGMAVVRDTVRELGGTLTLQTEQGHWTQFTLRLPLTLSIMEAFIVSAGAEICAVPQNYVEEIVQVSAEAVRPIQQVEVIPYRDGLLPIVRLHNLFKNKTAPSTKLTVLVLQTERGTTGLAVDRVQGQREVVVQAMRDPLLQVPGVSGATELGNGRPVLILDAIALTQGAVRPRRAQAPVSSPLPVPMLSS